MQRIEMTPYLIDVRGEDGPYGIWDYLSSRPFPKDGPEIYATWEAARLRVEDLNSRWYARNPAVRLLPLRIGPDGVRPAPVED